MQHYTSNTGRYVSRLAGPVLGKSVSRNYLQLIYREGASCPGDGQGWVCSVKASLSIVNNTFYQNKSQTLYVDTINLGNHIL